MHSSKNFTIPMSSPQIVSDLEYMVQWIWLSMHQVQIYFLNMCSLKVSRYLFLFHRPHPHTTNSPINASGHTHVLQAMH